MRSCQARLYQQNHCGIYRIDRPSDEWVRIGTNMPKRVGDIGFPMVVHPRDADTAWVLPMDGATVWPRTSVEGKPAVYATRNGGKTWQRQDAGMPEKQAGWTSALRSYTEAAATEASGATLAEVLADLERRYAGIRFRMIDEQDRIRRHIRIFINGEQVSDLSEPLAATDEVVIVQALSAG